MRAVRRVLYLTVFACGVTGCGGSSSGPADVANSNHVGHGDGDSVTAQIVKSGSANAASPASSGPSAVVAEFYEALRRGNDAVIAGLLTDKAREETHKSGLGIQSQASESLQYEISETEYVSDQMDGAHVRTTWMEPSPDGQMTATEVIWVLRKERDGWRISGMATPVVEGELPLLFNFEEPEDMLRKKEFVERQLGEQDETHAEVAEAPPSSAAPEMR